MKVTVDINVLLDVFQLREPHYTASAHVISMVETGGALDGIFPAHGLTTLYHIVRKHAGRQDAETAMDRVIDDFQIGNLDAPGWRVARSLPMGDFEDAAVATIAKKSGSDFIVTRNGRDFARSEVPAISPEDFLIKYTAKP